MPRAATGASIGPRNRGGGGYAYRAAKAVQTMFDRTAAIALGRCARNVIVLSLPPGTTDSGLSWPFHKRVPEGKLFSVDFVAERLPGIMERATTDDSGGFHVRDGGPIPW